SAEREFPMSLATVSFTTRLRTWLLVAGLSALLVAIGAAIGGGALWLFVAVAVLFNAGAYWFSDRLALRASRARPLPEDEAQALHADVRDLAARAGLPMPRIYLLPSEQPNAFATGRNPAHAAVAVTAGLLAHLPRDQVRGVLAHELAHVRNRDILVSSIAAVVAAGITAIANVFQLASLFGGADDEEGAGGLVGTV